MSEETYIGDGVYASFDGWMIKLRTQRANGDHVIYLEPDVYDGLVRVGDDWLQRKPIEEFKPVAPDEEITF